ncbi:MAG: hypothetical protein HYT76_00195 [Deltaproteobacteria bacterium]|nr:hypothetical protein [Deltaproteobacteria bacterium]
MDGGQQDAVIGIGRYARALSGLRLITPADGMERLPGELKAKVQPWADRLGDSRFEIKARYHYRRLVSAANRAAAHQKRYPLPSATLSAEELRRWYDDLGIISYEMRRAYGAMNQSGWPQHRSAFVIGLFYSGVNDAFQRAIRVFSSQTTGKLTIAFLLFTGLLSVFSDSKKGI